MTLRNPLSFYHLRAAYVRWSLRHVEESVKHARDNLKAAEYEAQRLRVELALLEAL